jgi:hypothetical protein
VGTFREGFLKMSKEQTYNQWINEIADSNREEIVLLEAAEIHREICLN